MYSFILGGPCLGIKVWKSLVFIDSQLDLNSVCFIWLDFFEYFQL